MKKLLSFLSFLLVVIFITGCEKDNNNATRQVSVRLTDNPFDADEVNVDIRSVQLKHQDDDNDPNTNEEDHWVTINTEDSIYNLLDLQNGVNVLLAQGPYPYDHIKEIRLILGDNNSIKIGNNIYDLTIPSGSSSGLKIKVDREMHEGNNDFLVDFDAALSIHETGNGKYILRPVLRLK